MYTYEGGLNGFAKNSEVTLTGYDSSLNESSSSGNGLHLMELWNFDKRDPMRDSNNLR